MSFLLLAAVAIAQTEPFVEYTEGGEPWNLKENFDQTGRAVQIEAPYFGVTGSMYKPMTAWFELTNTTNSPIEIQAITAPLWLEVITPSTKTILPNQTIQVPFSFNFTQMKPGRTVAYIKIIFPNATIRFPIEAILDDTPMPPAEPKSDSSGIYPYQQEEPIPLAKVGETSEPGYSVFDQGEPEFMLEINQIQLKKNESHTDSYQQNGIQKTITATFKGFQDWPECPGQNFSTSICNDLRKIRLDVEIQRSDTETIETREILFQNFAGGDRRAILFPDEYQISLNNANPDETVSIDFMQFTPITIGTKTNDSIDSPKEPPQVSSKAGLVIARENSLINNPTENHTTMLRQNTAIATTELTVEVTDGDVFVKTSDARKPLSILPEAASQVIQSSENTNCTELVLKEKAQKLVYECKTTQTGKLLGFIPIEFETITEVNAENGETNTQKPFWSFLIFD